MQSAVGAELGGTVHLLGHGEQRRGNMAHTHTPPIPHVEISPSQELAVGCVFKWVCLLTLVGVEHVPAVMKQQRNRS